MKPKKLIRQLYLTFLLIIIVPALVFTWYTTRAFKGFLITSTIEGLTGLSRQTGSWMVRIDDDCDPLIHAIFF